MGRWGLVGCDASKIFDGCLSAKGVVRSEGIELVGESVDPLVEALEGIGEFP